MDIEDIHEDWWRSRVDPAELRTRWADDARLLRMVDDLTAGMIPGDELWFYDIGARTGLGVRRNGRAVKTNTYVRAYVGPPRLIVRWVDRAPFTPEIFALRRLDPRLMAMASSAVILLLRRERVWEFKDLSTAEMDRLEAQCIELDLPAERS